MNRKVSEGYPEHYRYRRGNKHFKNKGKSNQGNHHLDGEYTQSGYTHKLKRHSHSKQRNSHFGGEYSKKGYGHKKHDSSNKAISSLVGSKEGPESNVQAISKLFLKQLDEDPDGDIILPAAKAPDKEPQIPSETANKSQRQQKQNTKSSNLKTVSGNLTGPEISRLMHESIADLSPQIKRNLINQGSHSYDAAIQRQARSRENCDMSSTKVHARNCKALNDIYPDAVANLEGMSQEEIAKLSNTLNIDLDHAFEADGNFAEESIRSNDSHTTYVDRHIKSEPYSYETNSGDSPYRENYNNSNSFAEDVPENNFSNNIGQDHFQVFQSPQLWPSTNESSPQRNICFNNFEVNSPHSEYRSERLQPPPMLDLTSAPLVSVPPLPVPEPTILPQPSRSLADMSALFKHQPKEVRTLDFPNQSQVPQQRHENAIVGDYSSRTIVLSNDNQPVRSNDNHYHSRNSSYNSRNHTQSNNSEVRNDAPKKKEVWNRIVIMADSLKRNRTPVPCTHFTEDYRSGFNSRSFHDHFSQRRRSPSPKRLRRDPYRPRSKSPVNRTLINVNTNTAFNLNKDKDRDQNSNRDIATRVQDADWLCTRTIISNNVDLHYDDAVERKDENCDVDTTSLTNDTTSMDNEENDNSVPSDINEEKSVHIDEGSESNKPPEAEQEMETHTLAQETLTPAQQTLAPSQEKLTPASQVLNHPELNSKGASIIVIQTNCEADINSLTNDSTSMNNEGNDNSAPSGLNEDKSMHVDEDLESNKAPEEEEEVETVAPVQETSSSAQETLAPTQEMLTRASQLLKHPELNSKVAPIIVIQTNCEADINSLTNDSTSMNNEGNDNSVLSGLNEDKSMHVDEDLESNKPPEEEEEVETVAPVQETSSSSQETLAPTQEMLTPASQLLKHPELNSKGASIIVIQTNCEADINSLTNDSTSMNNEGNDNSVPSGLNEDKSMHVDEDLESNKPPEEEELETVAPVQETSSSAQETRAPTQEMLTRASQLLKHPELNSKGASIIVIQTTDKAGTYKTIKADKIILHDDIFIKEKVSNAHVLENIAASVSTSSQVDNVETAIVQNQVVEELQNGETELAPQCSEGTLPISNKHRNTKKSNAEADSSKSRTDHATQPDADVTSRHYEKLKREMYQMAIRWQSFERKLEDLMVERKQIRDWFSTILESHAPATRYSFDESLPDATDPIMNKEIIPEEELMTTEPPELVRQMKLVSQVSEMEINAAVNAETTLPSEASKLNNMLELQFVEVAVKKPVVELIKYNMQELEEMRKNVCNSKPQDEDVVIEEECEEVEISETEECIETSEVIIDEVVEHSDTVQNMVPLNEAYDFTGWQNPILVVKVIQGVVLAGDEKGFLYYFDITNGEVIYSTEQCTDAITCMCVSPISSNHIFIGSLDGNLYIVNIDERTCVKTIPVSAPIQCIETLWDLIFLGTRKGVLIKYDIKQNKLFNPIGISTHAILAIKANLEGARRVLLTATRDSSLTIRDARTGLLLRTISGSISHPTIFSLLYHKNRIYCGTSGDDVLVYGFQDGRLILKHEEPNGSGVTCMTMIEDLLFVGCYSSHIYVYNTVNNACIATLRGPPGLFSCMDVTRNQIITGTKEHFQSLPLPPSVLELL